MSLIDANIALESERVKLAPFDISKHLQLILQAPPYLFDYMVLTGPWSSEEQFMNDFWNPLFVQSNDSSLYAVYDKTKPEDKGFAGIVGYLHTSLAHLSTELAFIIILPEFQRTHVTSNAMGILMQYALNLPTDPHMPGLGLRRIAWRASSTNEKSVAAAKRMGFQVEGITRWTYVLNETRKGENGQVLREGDPSKKRGHDTIILSVCWDDWEGGAKELVQEKMDRR